MKTKQLDQIIEIWLDWSLSAEDQPYREAARTIGAALPELAARYHVTRVTAYQFGDRGWSAAELFICDLPASQAVKTDEADALFRQVKDEKEKQANQQYQSLLREKLSEITPEKLLPVNAIEPPCTDIQGVLNRIAATSCPQRRLVFLISDLNDACSNHLQPVSPASANTALVAVVLPEEQPSGAQRLKQQRPDQLWIQRRDEFQKASPGSIVIPYFGDLISAAADSGVYLSEMDGGGLSLSSAL